MIRFEPRTKRLEFSPGTLSCVLEGLVGGAFGAFLLVVALDHALDPTTAVVWRVLAASFSVVMLVALKRSVWLTLFTHHQRRVELWPDRIAIREYGKDRTIPLESIEMVEHWSLDDEPEAIIKLRSGCAHRLGRNYFESFDELTRFCSMANELLPGDPQSVIQSSEVMTDSRDESAELL
jgi:hypothetical protein